MNLHRLIICAALRKKQPETRGMNKSCLRFSCCHRAGRRKLRPNFSAWAPKSHNSQDMYQPLRSPTMANRQMCFHEQFFQVASYWQMRHLSCGPVWFPDSQSPVNWWHIAWTIKLFKSSSGRISHRVAWYNWMLYRLTLCFLVNFPPPGFIKDLWVWVHFQHFHILKFLDYPDIPLIVLL